MLKIDSFLSAEMKMPNSTAELQQVQEIVLGRKYVQFLIPTLCSTLFTTLWYGRQASSYRHL